MGDWTIHIRNDSWNLSEMPLRFRAVLTVADLEGRVAAELEQRVALMARYPSHDNGISQPSVEAARLRAFAERLRAEDPIRPVEIGATELPVPFRTDLFAEAFQTLTCMKCGRTSRPEETHLAPWEEEGGMQHYGTARRCSCGAVIAVEPDGYRKP